MTDLGLILETIEATRAARAANDFPALAAQLAPGARYRIASGSPLLPSAFAAERSAHAALAEMIGKFTFLSFETDQVLVEGDRAAIRLSVTTPGPDGAAVRMEIASFWAFDEEGRITEIVDFVDTALIAQMIGTV